MHLTVNQINEFKQDPVWIELVNTWEERRKGHLHEIMEGVNIDGNTLTLEDIYYRRGQIKDLDFSIIQPQLLIDEIEDASNPEPTLNEDDKDED